MAVPRYAADFETTTIEPATVWAWGIANTETPDEVEFGTDIESFLEWCQKQKKNPIVYFHNEKFDGSFIIDYLLRNGYVWKKEKGKCNEREFTTIIDNFNKFYSIEIYWKRSGHKVKKVTIYDSFKIIPMKVEFAAKKFGLAIQKLEIDYERHNVPCKITSEEWQYLRHDVSIMAQILKICFEFGMTKMTLAGCCMADYKAQITQKQFERWFPKPPIDVDRRMRKAYKGGWTYCLPDNAGREVGEGLVFDVNSLYPSQMAQRPLPFGVPMYFQGKYKPNPDYPLYIQHFRCRFRIKQNKLPMIQLKGNMRFCPTEYLTTSGYETVELCLASPDMMLFFRHYDVFDIEWLDGWCFRESKILFSEWVAKWANRKIAAEQAGNAALRQICKLFMNSLYGRFCINPFRKSKMPVWNAEKEIVQYKPILQPSTRADGSIVRDAAGNIVYTDYELTEPVYLPVGIFITAWARFTTISAAQKVHEESILATGHSRFCYADTDSIHILGTDIPEGLDVDPYRLGAWKCESHFTRAKFLQAKRYIEEIDGNLKVTCAGMPAACHEHVTFENFNIGAIYEGKLVTKTVKGGTILVPTPFEMKG